MSSQDPAHGPRWNAELWSEPVLAPAMLDPCTQHELFDFRGRSGRGSLRARRTVVQTGLALGIETSDPTMGALARDPHRSSDMRDRHLLPTDPLHKQQPAVECQAGVTVTHEDLLDCGDGNPHSTRRSSLTSTRHQRPGRVQL